MSTHEQIREEDLRRLLQQLETSLALADELRLERVAIDIHQAIERVQAVIDAHR